MSILAETTKFMAVNNADRRFHLSHDFVLIYLASVPPFNIPLEDQCIIKHILSQDHNGPNFVGFSRGFNTESELMQAITMIRLLGY